MKKFIFVFTLVLICSQFFLSCSTTTPQKYFEIAVLNSNLFAGFSGTGFSRELQSPSAKLTESGGESVMKRNEVISTKIDQIEINYDKVKSLKVTDDTKGIIDASLNLYEYILPVCKTEYIQLAEMYDNNAPQDQIQTLTMSIFDKYNKGFTDRYGELLNEGKIYAEKNSIKVNWLE